MAWMMATVTRRSRGRCHFIGAGVIIVSHEQQLMGRMMATVTRRGRGRWHFVEAAVDGADDGNRYS